MNIKPDYYLSPLFFARSSLSTCDVDLVKKTLARIFHPFKENTNALEPSRLADMLNHYIDGCNNAFLASERIRLFLLASFIASTTISFIALSIVPISILSVSLVCILSLLLLSTNFFILLNQIHGYHQESSWDMLKKYYSDYTKNLYSKKFNQNLTSSQEKIYNSTASFCLFTPQKIRLADHFKYSTHADASTFNAHLVQNNEDAYQPNPCYQPL